MILHFVFMTFVSLIVANPVVEKEGGLAYKPHSASVTENFELGLYKLLPIYSLGVEPRQELKDSALSNDAIPREYQADAVERMKKVLQTGIMPPVLDYLQWSGYPQYAWRTNRMITNYTTAGTEFKIFLLCGASDISITISSDTQFGDEVSDLTNGKIVESASRILSFPSEMIPKIVVEQKKTIIEGIPVCYGVMRCEFDDTAPPIQVKEWWRRIPFWIIKGKMNMDIWTEEHIRTSTGDPWKF